jgi:carboxyl-terminal processing protease
MAQEAADEDAPTTPAALAKRVDEICGRIGKRPDRVWIGAYELRELAGKDAEHLETLTPAFTKQLDNESEHVRLAALQVLLSLFGGDEELLYDTLGALVREAGDTATVAAAARLVAVHGPGAGKHSAGLLEAIEERNADTGKLSAEARVNLAEAMVSLKKDKLSTDRLRQLAASSTPAIRDRAALALSRLGYADEVQGRVAALAAQSGELALCARLAQEVASDRKVIAQVNQGGARIRKRDLVPAVVSAVVTSYAETSMTFGLDDIEVDAPNLVDAAARGMVGSLDAYSQYLTAKEYRKSNEEMQGTYVGIGAHVQKAEYDPAVRIAQPIYSGPAYAAGLRSGDLLWELEVDGKRTSLVGMETEEVRNLLIGPKGSSITIFVRRPGANELVKITLQRDDVDVNTCEGTMLPGRIGYMRLTRFGGQSQVDMYRTLELLKIQGMKGIILDLRGNGGGYLHVVTQIAALFLKGEPQIALIKGVYDGYAKPKIETASGPLDRENRPIAWPRHDQPMVVLIDGASASGSELLSGCLKDHGRATVVGEKSFGKGVGQATYPITKPGLDVEARDDNGRMLKVTVFNYYILPSMTSVERVAGVGGVVPHIEVHNPTLSTWEYYRSVDIAKGAKLAEWVRVNWTTHRDAWLKLADYDGGDPNQYPAMDELRAHLGTPLSANRLRQELRREIRAVAADERRRPYIQSFEDDYVLQRGLLVLGSKIEGFDIRTVPQYQFFLGNHPANDGE